MNLALLLIAVSGFAILSVVGIISWHRDSKDKAIHWVSRHVYRNGEVSEQRARSALDVMASIGLLIGGIMLVYVVYVLSVVHGV